MAFNIKPVLTVDIVDFSTRTVPDQTLLVQDFIVILNLAIPADQNKQEARIWSPAGDGGAITFWDSVPAALETAVNIAHYVREYNQGAIMADGHMIGPPSRPLQVRMGIHSGPVSRQRDFDDRINVWGDGINTSARLISLAQPDQILVSEDYYKAAQLYSDTRYNVKPLGKGWVKHNRSVVVYNVNTPQAGILVDETENWFGTLHYPLQRTIQTYKSMLVDEYLSGKPFRMAVVAKLLRDLEINKHSYVIIEQQRFELSDILSSISTEQFKTGLGKRTLYDSFFSPLTSDAILYFFNKSHFEVFERGIIIAQQGDRAEKMMTIISGEVGVYRDQKPVQFFDTQTQMAIDISFKEGDLIGEMGFFNPLERRNATLQAQHNTMVLSIDYDSLRPLPSDNDVTGLRLSNCFLVRCWPPSAPAG